MADIRQCWKCRTEYPAETVVCVKCGINLVTGKELQTAVPQEQEAAPVSPLVAWLGDTLPGLFRPPIVLAAGGTAVVAVILVWFGVHLLLVAPIGSFGMGAMGLIIYAQGLAWLINGDFSLLNSALADFRGKDWSNFTLLVLLPIMVVFFLARQEQKAEQLAEQGGPPPPPKPAEPPPVPGEYDIVYVRQLVGADGFGGGHKRSALAADTAGNLYFVNTDGYRAVKLNPASGVLTVIAGTGQKEWTPDGKVAANAPLHFPRSVAADSKGNVYIVDGRYVRKVDEKGVFRTVAGSPGNPNTGDGGPASKATLGWEPRVYTDAHDNLFILDLESGVIRKVDAATGIISHVAGDGKPGYGGDGGPATEASFWKPASMALDRLGNIYVADTLNFRIRRIDGSTGKVETLAGTGKLGYAGVGGQARLAKICQPHSVAADTKGHVFFAGDDNRVMKIDAATGVLSVAAGIGKPGDKGDGGPATLAEINLPGSLVADAKGNVYIGDDRNRRIRRLEYVGQRPELAPKKK